MRVVASKWWNVAVVEVGVATVKYLSPYWPNKGLVTASAVVATTAWQ